MFNSLDGSLLDIWCGRLSLSQADFPQNGEQERKENRTEIFLRRCNGSEKANEQERVDKILKRKKKLPVIS